MKAVPLLRKMSITTSSGHESFGADAIHYKIEPVSYTHLDVYKRQMHTFRKLFPILTSIIVKKYSVK